MGRGSERAGDNGDKNNQNDYDHGCMNSAKTAAIKHKVAFKERF